MLVMSWVLEHVEGSGQDHEHNEARASRSITLQLVKENRQPLRVSGSEARASARDDASTHG
jgi:hypothetical protein